MLENQFSLTRAASRTGGLAKRKFLSLIPIAVLALFASFPCAATDFYTLTFSGTVAQDLTIHSAELPSMPSLTAGETFTVIFSFSSDFVPGNSDAMESTYFHDPTGTALFAVADYTHAFPGMGAELYFSDSFIFALPTQDTLFIQTHPMASMPGGSLVNLLNIVTAPSTLRQLWIEYQFVGEASLASYTVVPEPSCVVLVVFGFGGWMWSRKGRGP